MDKDFKMVAKTFMGLEEILAGELTSLGAKNLELGKRMVSFEGDLRLMYAANLCCRTALRILKPIYKFEASDPDELYDAVRDIEWEEYMTPESTFVIDSTVNSSEFTHSKFVTYRVKDGIVDHFADRYGRRPSIRLSGADVHLNVHISENRVTISLDSSGEPLSRRGYRVEQTEAPINEVLAAGIIMLTGWRGDVDFADPMCGSGTFLIEAALIAANINPGIYRKSFAFEKWPDFNKELFEELYEDDSEEVKFTNKIYGGDIDPDAVAIARKNVKNAGLESMIEISCKSIADWSENAPEGVMVTNPPYGERLRPDDIENLYRTIGRTLKHNFNGWHAWIIGTRDDLFSLIGLKPSVKIPLLNGSLECSLREYVLFDGRYDDFRASGGSVAREEEDKIPTATRSRHLSDKEWKKEARDFSRKNAKKFDRRDSAKEGDREFKRDRRSESDRKKGNFRGKDDFRKKDSDFRKKDKEFRRSDTRKVTDKKPEIAKENEIVFSNVHFRRRSGWKKD